MLNVTPLLTRGLPQETGGFCKTVEIAANYEKIRISTPPIPRRHRFPSRSRVGAQRVSLRFAQHGRGWDGGEDRRRPGEGDGGRGDGDGEHFGREAAADNRVDTSDEGRAAAVSGYRRVGGGFDIRRRGDGRGFVLETADVENALLPRGTFLLLYGKLAGYFPADLFWPCSTFGVDWDLFEHRLLVAAVEKEPECSGQRVIMQE